MSSYQILRIALQTISTGDWTTHGVSMALAQEDKQDGTQVCLLGLFIDYGNHNTLVKLNIHD